MKNKIAIIGMSGLFPGSSTNEQFWENLLQKKDLTSMATAKDFGVNPDKFYQSGKGVVDKTYSLRGGYIRDFEFDPKGYAIEEEFLAEQDKLYQWSIYVAKEALAHAGYFDKQEELKKCGVILGNLSFPTGTSHKKLASVYTETTQQALRKLLKDDQFTIPNHIEKETPTGGIIDYTPSQMVVDALNLGGTHYALDAACATSLYAIKLACDELILGKADMMLAGAVCASDQLFIHMGFSIFHAYAPHEQKFVPLDDESAGLVSSEGAGMVVLKRLEDAQRDGDTILGVIGGIGLSNDGRGKFLLSPNPKGQKLAFERAYDLDQILPQNTSYLECHATGTPLGDVTELNSIADFFEQHQTKPLLGSVKSNMGHLLTAAGMTGLLKVLLAMEKEVIPSNINLEKAVKAENGWIGKEQMILQPTEWKGDNRQAGINSFGFGGTNAHMVVEDGKRYTAHGTRSAANSQLATRNSQLAIIGMDAHFGKATNLNEFYQTIYQGKQQFTDLPKERWKGFDANEKLLKDFGFVDGKAPKGAYIDNFEIDLLRYKIQPKEAETLEPQQALILKVADNAIKNAGLAESQNVAVLIAMESELAIHHYLARWDVTWQLKAALKKSGIELTEEELTLLEEQCKDAAYFREGSQTPSQHTSFVGNIMASRIAALWDFNGPAFTVSAGDNSVFKALEIAQNMLALGEVEAVVVGGVDFAGSLENVLLRNQQKQGQVFGEGAGAIVLKRVENTTADKVYAEIDGFEKLGANFKLAPNLGYLELVGGAEPSKGLELLEGLNRGSISENIGNTCAASGIASIIKTALCLHHRFLPDGTNIARPWIVGNETSKVYRKAAIMNQEQQYLQLSEARTASTQSAGSSGATLMLQKIFLLKGDDEQALIQQLAALEIALDTNNSLSTLAQQFYAKASTKQTKYSLVVIAKSKKALTGEIKFFQKALANAFKNGKAIKTPKGSYFTPNPLGKEGKVAFVYPGSATAYEGLGRELFQLFPQLYAQFGDLKPDLDTYVNSKYLYPAKAGDTFKVSPALSLHQDTIAMMSSGVFFSAAYTHILRNVFKLEPKIAFGYSMGECSSMWYSTRVWSADETNEFRNSPIFKNRFAGNLELLAEHWKVSSSEAKERWTSLVVLAPKDKVEKLVEQFEEVYLTFINTSKEVIISGDKTACQAIVKQLNCHTVEIPFQNIIHHHFCEKEREGLIKMHNFPLVEKPVIDFYSSITQSKIPLDSLKIAENSTQVCVEQVNFPKTVQTVYNDGARIFIEVGANATCTGWVNEILKGQDFLSTSINYKGKSDSQAIVELLAQLVSHGVELDLSALYADVSETAAKRTFMKKIEVGGKRIFEVLLSEEMQEKFAGLKKLERTEDIPLTPFEGGIGSVQEQTRVEELELVEVGSNSFLANTNFSKKENDYIINKNDNQKPINNKLTTDIKLKNGTLPPFDRTLERKQPATSNQQLATSNKNQPSNNMTTTVAPAKIKNTIANAIGENGLEIHDFSTGEHLKGKEIIFTQADLEEFATGKIANVFGPAYSIIDTYSRRVMLPMYPYLLVSRVTGLKGKLGEYKPSTMQTEYDIPHNAWFTTDRQIPWAVSVESGQCDLLLISYLGIDLTNKGNLVYRLLDCTLTFVDDLPFEGQTLRYDISINSFVRNGENLLFFFSYRCYVEDRLVLKMDNGCAGFFRDEELESGAGVVYTDKENEIRQNAKKRHFTPLLKTNKTSFTKDDLRHLINGDMEKCFEDIGYFANGRNPSLRLPPEKILMIDRIQSVDIRGGAYGLGYIVAEKDLAPDDWYFPCHFRDDEVLAGSLQAEGGGNLLRFFMLYLGLQRLVKDARYQPVFDLPQKVRCRKQVTPTKDTKLVYKLEIKEIGLIPNPYVIGDLEIISDGVVTVHFENLGLQLREKDNPRYLEIADSTTKKENGVVISPRSEGALMNELDVTTFALDDLSKCFGEEFAVYDGRTVSRQPNTDLQVISRILKIDGERHFFKKPSTCYAEYDVPVDAWYYEQNSAVTMPYSVLMEIALQPCGLLGAYLGSTLKFPDKNLYFRNLDGDGEMFDLPTGTDFRGKTIKNKAILASSVALGGTILQNYTFECSIDGHVFYKGKSSFGFFPGEALASQVGLDNGKDFPAWYVSEGLTTQDYMQIKLDSLYGKMKLFKAPADKPHYKLAGDQLLLLDKLIIAKNSGQHGKGYIHATKYVNTYDWFFTCHFYQDPVMPGSLGVEAILQAMQTFALQQDLGKDFVSPKFVQLKNHKTIWKYRGQILWKPAEMNLEVHIKTIEKRGDQLAIIADAYLWNGKMRIYQVTDLALGIEEA